MVALFNRFAEEVTNSLPISQSRRSPEWAVPDFGDVQGFVPLAFDTRIMVAGRFWPV